MDLMADDCEAQGQYELFVFRTSTLIPCGNENTSNILDEVCMNTLDCFAACFLLVFLFRTVKNVRWPVNHNAPETPVFLGLIRFARVKGTRHSPGRT
jgi:hypothetical protein